MKKILLAVLTTVISVTVQSQLLSWTPPFPTETDNITITVDATQGNKGLLGYSGNVYVHIGAITTNSTGSSDWLHVPFTWGSTQAAALATPAGTNKWSFTINNPRTFFNLVAGEQLKYIAILFRTGGCSGSSCIAQRNADGTDMYVPIYNNNLAVRIDNPFREPKYNPTPATQNWNIGSAINVEAKANKPSAMKLYHNGVLIATQTNVQTITGSSTVTAFGNQQIVAEANDGTTVKYDTLNVFVSPASSPVAALPAGVKDGINYQPGDTSVILVLHAPGKNIVTVTGDFNNWVPDTSHIMRKTPDGNKFWIRIKGLTPGTEYAYQFRVDDTIKIADPYAEKVLDPWNDQHITAATYPNLKPYPAGQTGIVSVLRTATPAYNWAVPNFSRPDKRGLIIYELLLRDFVAAHDWKTLSDTLNYLKRLGVNAIEIMPFNEFEGNLSWGYNTSFYFAPDKYYGPANTLKRFIDSAHKNGMAVIMDIVLNHSYGQSPMVQLYWDSQNNRPAANNPWYNPTPRHAFNVGYDMNHESLATRYFSSRVLEHWLKEYKIDGFRFDLSKGFTQNNTCDPNGGNCNAGAMANYDQSRIDIWKRYYDTVQSKSNNAYVILEHFADNSEEKVLADYGMLLWGNLSHAYGEAAMGWISNSNLDWGLHTARNWNQPHLITYMESHDEERLMYRAVKFGNSAGGYSTKDTTTALKRMALDAAFFFTIPGPKMIWQFGELGYDYSINHCPDGTVNNDCRTGSKPIRWDYYADPRRRALYNTYSRLINLRFHQWYKDAFLSGTIERSLGGAFKWLKVNSGDTSKLLVVGNFDLTAMSGTVTFPNAGTWYNYLDSSTFTATGNAQTISLQPGEYRVYVNRNVNNTPNTPVINIPASGNALQAKVYPIPIQSNYVVELYIPQTSNTEIQLLNSLGQYVSTIHNTVLPKGKHLLSFNRTSIAAGSGVYYLRIATKSGFQNLQVTLQ